MVLPIAAAAAAPEPLIAPKSMFAITLDCANAPGIRPPMTFAQFTSLNAIPPLFIMFPARMKNGIAISENELEPAKILCADVANATLDGSMQIMETAEESPIPTPMGTPAASNKTRRTTITRAT